MSDLEAVMMCRARLMELRQRSQELAILHKSQGLLPEAVEELQVVIDKAQIGLDQLRRDFPHIVSKTLNILLKLPYKERRVLMLFYVSGASVSEIGREMGYTGRTVQKIKKSGLDKLR